SDSRREDASVQTLSAKAITQGARISVIVTGLLVSMVVGFTPARGQAPASSPATHASPNPATSPAAVPPAAPVRPQVSAAPGVEEIVVTAQKREQLSQEVPIALTALTASSIQFRGIQDLTDLSMQVPGMQFGADTGNDQQIYIRGIGVDDASGSIESPIA